LEDTGILVYIGAIGPLREVPGSCRNFRVKAESNSFMNVFVLIVAGVLVIFLLYLIWRITRGLWKSRDDLFLLLRFALAASFLFLIGYILYQNFDLGDLLMGFLWLSLGIFLLSALLATVEKLEQNFKLKEGNDKDKKTSPG
jgi:amino acid transporter